MLWAAAPPTSAGLLTRSAATGRVRAVEAERRVLCPSPSSKTRPAVGAGPDGVTLRWTNEETFEACLAAVKADIVGSRTFRRSGSFPFADRLDENTQSKTVVTV
jgi:hypothetical protein